MTPVHSLTLRDRILRAGGWSVAGYGISQAIRLGSNLIMTRLLVPEMFGVMAIATMVMMGLAMFSDLGLRQSVVQSRIGYKPEFLNTVWVLQIVQGITISLVAIGVSALCAFGNRLAIFPADSVYADPSLPLVVGVLSVGSVINGLGSTKLLEASRNLQLGQLARLELAAQLTGLACMLAWVAIDRSIWALVSGSLGAALARTMLSHFGLPGVPNRLQWNAAAHRQIMAFGKWIVASSILGFLVNNGDRVLLGGFVSTNVLGIYAIAFLIYSALEQAMTRLIGDVAFPALSEIVRQGPSDLKRSYYRFHGVIAPVAYFLSGLLMIAGAPLMTLLYDERYADAGWMLQILSAALLVVPLHLATQCFLALGQSRLLANIISVRLVALYGLLPIGFHLFGVPGALWVILLGHFSWAPVAVFYLLKNKVFNPGRELRFLAVTVIGIGIGLLLDRALTA